MPAVYRYDVSPNNRASCQSTQCKDAAVKIMKGELRFATLVTIQAHDSWKYKHWGCVTPLQISNIIEQIGGLDGLDLESDLDILDGYEELESWAQEKVKSALKNGHVDDEDWKGDPELNRPGQKGITKKRTPKKKKKDEEEDEENQDGSPTKPKAKRGRSKPKVEDYDDEDDAPAPRKKAAGKKRKATENAEDSEPTEEAKPKKRAARKTKTNVKEEEDEDDQAVQAPPKKRGKKAKQVDEVDVPETKVDVEEESDAKAKPGRKKNTKAETDSVPAKKAGRPRKVKNEEDSPDELADEPAKSAKKETSRKTKKTKEATVKDEEPVDDAEDEPAVATSKPAKKISVRSRKSKDAEPDIDAAEDQATNGADNAGEDDEEAIEAPKTKRGKGRPRKG